MKTIGKNMIHINQNTNGMNSGRKKNVNKTAKINYNANSLL